MPWVTWLLMAQMVLTGGHRKIFTAASATPGFVGETSKNSTLTNAVGTNPSGQTACSAYSYCLPYPELTLSGNIGIVSGHFANSTTLTPTATDDKSDTYTCSTGSAKDSGTNEWPFLCYAANLTAGAKKITVTFGTTAVTQVTAKAASFYNVATTSPLDGSIGSCAGASSTTANCASVTTTGTNDAIYTLVCRAGTPATTSFTAGSGYTLGTEDINDGCASEYRTTNSPGTITPSMTMASASTYIEIVAAFKSASAGTAPTGWYMDRLMSWSTPGSASGTKSFQFTSTGNLLFMLPTCGSTLYPTGVTGNQTWTQVGTLNAVGIAYTGPEFYVPNAAADSTGGISVANTGTGDCTYTFESYQGAPSSPIVGRAAQGYNASATGSTLPWYCDGTSGFPSCPGGDGSGGSTRGWFAPYPTAGLVLGVGGLDFNTFTGVNTPSGFQADTANYGGEAISGPEPVDENNIWFHGYVSSGGQASLVTNVSSASLAVDQWSGDAIGVWGATSTYGIKNWAERTGTTSPVSITVPSTTAGNLLGVTVQVYPSQAVTSVKCNDAGTTSFTQLAGATSTGSGHGATSIWYILSAPSGCTSVTITSSGSSNLEASYVEGQKASGTWATDGGTQTTNGTGSGTTVSAPAITTTGSADVCIADVAVSGSGITAAPKSGNEYTYGAVIWHGDGNAAAGLLTTTAGSHQPQWTDGTSADSYSSSHGCFK